MAEQIDGATLLTWARRSVEKWLRAHPAHWRERDDLVSYAAEQALRAAPRYDPAKASLRTFLDRRMQGACADYMRTQDPAGRTMREKMCRGEIGLIVTVSADELIPGTDMPRVNLLPDPDDQYAAVDDDIDGALLWRTILAQFPPRTVAVLTRLAAGDTLAVIAADLQVSESRVCQIKNAALRTLRADHAEPLTA